MTRDKNLLTSVRFDLKPPYSIGIKALAAANYESYAEVVRGLLDELWGPSFEQAPNEVKVALEQYEQLKERFDNKEDQTKPDANSP